MDKKTASEAIRNFAALIQGSGAVFESVALLALKKAENSSLSDGKLKFYCPVWVPDLYAIGIHSPAPNILTVNLNFYTEEALTVLGPYLRLLGQTYLPYVDMLIQGRDSEAYIPPKAAEEIKNWFKRKYPGYRIEVNGWDEVSVQKGHVGYYTHFPVPERLLKNPGHLIAALGTTAVLLQKRLVLRF